MIRSSTITSRRWRLRRGVGLGGEVSGIDILVNTATIAITVSIGEYDFGNFEKMLAASLTDVFVTTGPTDVNATHVARSPAEEFNYRFGP
jgi:NAD(P)-dependent dehydrogenase (short-subunit alcohol dehydrogenase family)